MRENENGRIYILAKCVENDVIPDFLKFFFLKTDVFSDQVVRVFHIRSLEKCLVLCSLTFSYPSGKLD